MPGLIEPLHKFYDLEEKKWPLQSGKKKGSVAVLTLCNGANTQNLDFFGENK